MNVAYQDVTQRPSMNGNSGQTQCKILRRKLATTDYCVKVVKLLVLHHAMEVSKNIVARSVGVSLGEICLRDHFEEKICSARIAYRGLLSRTMICHRPYNFFSATGLRLLLMQFDLPQASQILYPLFPELLCSHL